MLLPVFEVDGDSMLQLGSKGLRSVEIVIAKYVDRSSI